MTSEMWVARFRESGKYNNVSERTVSLPHFCKCNKGF